MNFFVPFARDPDTAEWVWAHMRDYLEERDLPTTDRRILALVCEIDGSNHVAAVGGDTPEREGDPILVILEADGDEAGIYYVCTLRQIVDGAVPMPLSLGENWSVLDFDGSACGWA